MATLMPASDRTRSGGDPVGHGNNFGLTNVFNETIAVPFRCKPR